MSTKSVVFRGEAYDILDDITCDTYAGKPKCELCEVVINCEAVEQYLGGWPRKGEAIIFVDRYGMVVPRWYGMVTFGHSSVSHRIFR
jgi:hypothetical protein